MMKKFIFTLLFHAIFLVSVAQKTHVQVIEADVYKQQITGDPMLQFIDIRTPEEYATGFIEGAENIDFLAEGFLPKMNNLNKDQPVYIYCRSGKRSAEAAAQLSEIGFKNIIDLKGGYKAWVKIEEEE